MSISLAATLEKVESRIDAAMKAAKVAAMLLNHPPDTSRLEMARQQALAADENAQLALAALSAEIATIRAGAPQPRNFPLMAIDTTANRALLAALDAAVSAADAVDAERGRVATVRLSEFDTLGTDVTQYLNQIRAWVYLEVHGTKGSENNWMCMHQIYEGEILYIML